MEELSTEIAAIESELADPTLFQRQPDRFAELSSKLTSAQNELDRAEEQWLELEIKREQLEG